MLRKVLIGVLLWNLVSVAQALELGLDFSNFYVEGAMGNVDYNTPNDFLFDNDSYEKPTGINVLAGVHFNNDYTENNFISLEAFFQYFGEVEDSRNDNGTVLSGDLTTFTVGGGLKFAKAVKPDVHIYTRFGLHNWYVSGDRFKDGLKSNNCCSEDGIGTYGGLGVSALMYKRFIVKGEFVAYPVDLQGENFHLKVFAFGVGMYF